MHSVNNLKVTFKNIYMKLPFVKKIFILKHRVQFLEFISFALGRHVKGDRDEKEGCVRQPEENTRNGMKLGQPRKTRIGRTCSQFLEKNVNTRQCQRNTQIDGLIRHQAAVCYLYLFKIFRHTKGETNKTKVMLTQHIHVRFSRSSQ